MNAEMNEVFEVAQWVEALVPKPYYQCLINRNRMMEGGNPLL